MRHHKRSRKPEQSSSNEQQPLKKPLLSDTSIGVGLLAFTAVASTPSIMGALYKDSIYNAGFPGFPTGLAATALTGLAAPVVGLACAIGNEILTKSSLFKPVEKNVVDQMVRDDDYDAYDRLGAAMYFGPRG